MPAMPFRVTQTGVSTTGGYPAVYFADYLTNPFNVSVGCVVNSTATVFTVQHSFDDVTATTFSATSATWFPSSGIVAATTAAHTAYNYPVTAIRLISTAGSSTGTVLMTVLQS